MADQTANSNSGDQKRPVRTGVGARLWRVRWLLLATFSLMCVLLVFGRVTLAEGVAGVFALTIVAALIPHRSRTLRTQMRLTEAPAHGRDEIVAAFAEALGDPCIIVDGRSVIRHLNKAASAQFPRALVGSPITFSLRHPALISAIEKCKSTLAQQQVEVQQTIPNEIWYKVTIAPLDLGGPPATSGQARFVLTLHDLTEQRRIDAMRADFIANASHELRTPLTSVIGFIDTLLGPAANDAEARARFLGIMRQQAERMSNLISDLLSLSRIEQRQRLLPSDQVDLTKLLPEVVEGLHVQAREADVEVKASLPGEACIVVGDRDELYEVFENLLDNAIKYGADGDSVELVLAAKDAGSFRVTITDHGEGIESAHVPRLTERFYRVDAESSRKKKGTGLGLAIVKHIVNRHRGQMTIRSTVGEGTSVEVILPRQTGA